MSSWGAAIFSDDLTADVRDTYREFLLEGASDSEATLLTLVDYEEVMGSDHEHLVWLALAAAQHQAGRLQPDIRDRALEVIDNDVGLEHWTDPGGKVDPARVTALTTLRAKLTGPQYSPRRIRRPWADTTDLVLGDVLQFVVSDSRSVLFRVVAVATAGGGSVATLGWLDWTGTHAPPREVIAAIPIRPGTPTPAFDPPPELLETLAAMPEALESLTATFADLANLDPLALYRVSRSTRSAPAWNDCGFTRVTSLGPDAHDQVPPNTDMIGLIGCDWDVLAAECERHTTGLNPYDPRPAEAGPR